MIIIGSPKKSFLIKSVCPRPSHGVDAPDLRLAIIRGHRWHGEQAAELFGHRVEHVHLAIPATHQHFHLIGKGMNRV